MSIPPLGRLSTRRGLPNDDDVLHEGVPEHLQGALQRWAMGRLGTRDTGYGVDLEGRESFLAALAVRYRVPVPWNHDPLSVFINLIHQSPEDFLDVVDGHLQTRKGGSSALNTQLALGGSAWQVVQDPVPHLERRVSDEQRALYAAAATPADEATNQLREAWERVYGRSPNPSDAWDHAIKAVEALLQPIVLPANDKATLGSILAALEVKPAKWVLTLETSSRTVGAVEALTGMLRLMWPNPDRHSTGSSRPPTQAEAEQVVSLAVLTVSWLRGGALQLAAVPLASP